eukprot:TRINITY_DN157_c1_g1_i1.p1 TRINITY_DN157_c1_g1~~TRINITY_DN157_c1_g1_i1.p1  ORF type:complete len:324 (+),score=70.42 TRINITY_DN157_c1_g1_i1:154-1125(+)
MASTKIDEWVYDDLRPYSPFPDWVSYEYHTDVVSAPAGEPLFLEKHFSEFYSKMTNGTKLDDFDFVPGVSYQSTHVQLALGMLGYMSLLFVLEKLMKDRPPMTFKWIFAIHNLFLSLVSAVLLGLILENIVPRIWANGFTWSLCHKDIFDGRLDFYIYLNYALKYYELLDTVFLVLKKKELQFLHVYHHVSTTILCFYEFHGKVSMQWTIIVMNLTVHVVMYYYFLRTTFGARLWWKKYLTIMQITQFVIDLTIIYLTVFWYVGGMLSTGIEVHGSFTGATVGTFVITSFFALFIQFFSKTYGPRAGAIPSLTGKAAKKGKVD